MCGIVLALLFVGLCVSPPLRQLLCLPDRTELVVGESFTIFLPLPRRFMDHLGFKVEERHKKALGQAVTIERMAGGYQLKALRPGSVGVTLRFFGYIPVKSMLVESFLPCKVTAGGHSIGILLQSKGIMVVGFAPIVVPDRGKIYPAREAGVRIGDIILEVNGKKVSTEGNLAQLVDKAGAGHKTLCLKIKRKENEMVLTVRPRYCWETGRYRIGLYVRDGIAGVGTLTLWESSGFKFAALGHVITDGDTGQVIKIKKGRIVTASIQSIQPGRPGRPGQKIGVFDREGQVTGKILSNSSYGVIGVSDRPIYNELYPHAVPVAYAHQVRRGPAEILTVIQGTKIERFAVNIEKVYPFRRNGKGMVLRITDPRLVSMAGGIVQGMSGSPIIQNGRLVGAVTHVFLNNPEKGYGTFTDGILKTMNEMEFISSRQIAQ